MKVHSQMEDIFSSWKCKKGGVKRVMPLDDERSVMDQFRCLPISILNTDNSSYWDELIDDDGDEGGWRRHIGKGGDREHTVRISKFHPQLAEIIIRYWSTEGDLIVDPFAGRKTRAIVALTLGRKYQGYEVACQTWEAARDKVEPLGGKIECMDGCTLAHTLNASADLVFTCPPYHRVERYDSAPGQLSDIKIYDDFLLRIEVCARNIFRVLKPGKFLCWVCADWCSLGKFILFHYDCIRIFRQQGFTIHDIVIIKNNSPFATLLSGKVEQRITAKIHEYLIVARRTE